MQTRIATGELEQQFQSQGKCPIDYKSDNQGDNLTFEVMEQTPALGNKPSSCVLIATIQNIPFPNRNLNGQTYILYRPSDEEQERWQCVTSLNEKQRPPICSSS